MLPSLPLGKLRAESGCCTSRVNGSVHLHTVVPGKNRNPQTVAPAKAGAQGRGMDTASTPDIDEHTTSQTPPSVIPDPNRESPGQLPLPEAEGRREGPPHKHPCHLQPRTPVLISP